MLGNARLVGFADSAPAVAPVPDSGMLKLGFEPLEVMLTLPVARPLAVGEKNTVNDALCPALSVTGVANPLKLNPAPLAAAAEIVRLDPPLFVRIPDSDFELLTWMVPKLKLEGFDPNCPCVTPLPESGTERVALLALELIVSVPLTVPADVGVKTALKVVPCPALRVTGVAAPVALKLAPPAVTLDNVTLVPPVFVTVTGTV